MFLLQRKSRVDLWTMFIISMAVFLSGCNANPHPDMPDLIPMKDSNGKLSAEFYQDITGMHLRNIRVMNFGAAAPQETMYVCVEYSRGELNIAEREVMELPGSGATANLRDLTIPPEVTVCSGTCDVTVEITVDSDCSVGLISEGLEDNNNAQLTFTIPG